MHHCSFSDPNILVASHLSNALDNSPPQASESQDNTHHLQNTFEYYDTQIANSNQEVEQSVNPVRPPDSLQSPSSVESEDLLLAESSHWANEDSLDQEERTASTGSISNRSDLHSSNDARPADGNDIRWIFLNRQAFRADWSPDEAAEEIMLKAFETYVYLIVLYIFGFLVVEEYLSISCLFSFNICIFLGQAVRILLFWRNDPTMTASQKRTKCFKAIDWILLLAFTTASSYRFVDSTSLLLTPFAVLGIVNVLLTNSYSSTKHSLLTKNTATHLSLALWSQLLLIAFQADGLLNNWNLVFVSLFYLLIFCMAFSIGIGAMIIPYLSEDRRSQNSDYPIAGLIWYILNGMHTWISGFILLGALERLSSHGGHNVLKFGFIAGVIHSGIVAVYMALRCEKIFIHLTSSLESIFGHAEKWNDGVLFETIKANIRYLLRVSPTYYMAVDKEFKVPNKKIAEDSKKQIKQVKSKAKLNTLSIKADIDLNELKSATLTKKRGQLFCSTPLTSSCNNNDMYYSDDDAEMMEEVQQKCQKHNEAEEKDQSCVICCLNRPNAVFMSCGHGGVCHDCAIKAWKNSNNCVFCRQPINEILKVAMINEVNIAKVTEGTRRCGVSLQTGEGYDWERWVS